MAEYIEREAAIAAAFSATSLGNSAFRDVYDTVNRLRLIPAADVRSVIRGKWKTVMYHLYECSECGAAYQDVGYGFNYCPNCGARMDGEEDV